MHLIPRYRDDEAGIGWEQGSLTDEAKEELVGLLKED